MAEKTKAGGSKGTAQAKSKKVSGSKKGKSPAKESASKAKASVDAPAEEEIPVPPPRLWLRYQDELRGALKETFGYTNDLAVPRLRKIVLSMGVGSALKNPKRLDEAEKHLTALAGQKAVRTLSKRAVSNFRLRIGNAIGCMVTLRRQRMYEFLDRLVSIAIPRIRDFRGLSDRSFDGRGNYSFGLGEQTVFTEIDADRMEFTQGLNVTFVTSAKTDKEAFELLKGFGFPFRKSGDDQRI